MRHVRGRCATYLIVQDARRNGRLTAMVVVGGDPFADFSKFVSERNLSLNRERMYAQSVVRLVEFIYARGAEFIDQQQRGELIQQFMHCLRRGTVSDAGADPSGLFWLPSSYNNVKTLAKAACDFSDWLVQRRNAVPLNPLRDRTVGELICFWRRWNTARAGSLLAHVKSVRGVDPTKLLTRKYPAPGKVASTNAAPKTFPQERFGDLMTVGTRMSRGSNSTKAWLKYNVRDQLMFLLMYAGGIRVSELCHIYVSDVYSDPHDPSSAHVRIYHPEDGEIKWADPANGNLKNVKRSEYLKMQYGRVPLTWSGRSGWKGMLLSTHGLWRPIFWIHPQYARQFLKLFKIYVENVRPVGTPHPYLFCTEAGQPMTPSSVRKRMSAACRRIGLIGGSESGASPHGLRHAYGSHIQDLVDANLVDRKIFQIAMGHVSIKSQESYNDREHTKVQNILYSNGDGISVKSIAYES